MTKRISLTQGKFAIVDDEDFDFINQWKWCFHKRYAVRNKNGHHIYMHREIVKPGVDLFVDHVNMDGTDNRRSNLRLCTKRENNINRGPEIGSSSKYKGVYLDKKKQKWVAQIHGTARQGHYIGVFAREEDAALAYNFEALKYFGEFARLNSAGG